MNQTGMNSDPRKKLGSNSAIDGYEDMSSDFALRTQTSLKENKYIKKISSINDAADMAENLDVLKV